MELLRFRLRRPVLVGQKLLSGQVSLVQIFPFIRELMDLGCLEQLPVQANPAGCVLVLKPSQLGEFGEVIDVTDVQDLNLWLAKGWVLMLYDPELNEVFSCEVCKKHYFTRALLAEHKERTGHRRKYEQRKRKSLREEDLELQ